MTFYPLKRSEIKVKPGYYCFVYLKNATWNNSSGHKIFSDFENPLYRGYSYNLTPLGRTRGGKYMICREAHHDKPMGHYSVFIMLTTSERLSVNIEEKCIKLANEVLDEYIKQRGDDNE